MIDEDLLKIKIPSWLVNYKKFARECLGFKDMNPKHNELCDFLQFNNKINQLILMPRYSFKSCLVTQGFALWNLLINPNLRILIYSDSASKAEGFLLGIKNHIAGRAKDSTQCLHSASNQEVHQVDYDVFHKVVSMSATFPCKRRTLHGKPRVRQRSAAK